MNAKHHDEKEHENDNNRQKNNNSSQNKHSNNIFESKSKVSSNGYEVSWTELDLKSPTSPDVTVIEMKNEKVDESINKGFSGKRASFKNFLRQLFKSSQCDTRKSYKKSIQKNPWVQFSTGKGYGGAFLGFGGSDGDGGFDYDPESRNTFVLIVMLITLAMLVVTAIWLVMVFQIPALFDIFHKPPLILLISLPVALMILWYVIMCAPYASQSPCVWIILVSMVILMSLTAGLVTARYNTLILFYAFLGTTAIVIVCAILACTSFDFTSFWLYFIVISVVFSVICMVIFIGMAVTGAYLKPLHILLLVVSTLLAAVGFTMELQMILGGKSIELSEDDYAMGAIMLYTSIIKIFLNLVQIIGLLSED